MQRAVSDIDGRQGTTQGDAPRVLAFDLPTRLFHWALVIGILCGYVSRYYGDADFVWHKWNGYGVLTLVVFRVIWGFVGGSTARFLAFFPTPASMWRYARGLVSGGGPHYLGHNPLGAAMILVMLVVVAAQGVTGLFNSNDILFDAPFVKLVSEAGVKRAGMLHHYNFELILLLVTLHVVANLIYQFGKREPVITAMLTGEKPAGGYADQAAAPNQSAESGGSLGLALLCLVIAAGLVLGTIRLIGGEL